MRKVYEYDKDRSLKKLQSQIREVRTDHPSYPEVVINLVAAHNRRLEMEQTLIEAVLHGEVEDKVYSAFKEDIDSPYPNLLDDYLRDAISRFVVNEL